MLLDEKTWQIIDDKVEYEQSMLYWSWGEKEMAKMQLKHLIKKITNYETESELLPEALRVMGSWLWTLRSEGAKTILKNYYKKSVELFEKHLEKAERVKDLDKSLQLAKDIAEAYNNLGTFCDEQYTHILNYMNSKDFEDKKTILEQISQDHQMRKEQGKTLKF